MIAAKSNRPNKSKNIGNRSQVKSNDKKDKPSILLQAAKTIEDCIKLSIDTDRFGYNIYKSMKKIKSGAFTINVRIYLKQDTYNHKTVLFIVDKDTKTNLIHVSIIDSDPLSPSVLFTTSDEYPIVKLERYIPSIIISTQNMIK